MNIYLYHLLDTLGIIRYVGLTQHINNTKSRHTKHRPKPPHTMEIIQTYHNREEAGLAEQYHIAAHKTFKDGWNGTIGGDRYLDWVDNSGENNPRWKDGRWANDPLLYMKIRRQRPEVILRQRMLQKQFYERNRDKILAYKQIPEVRLRHNRNRRINYARNREIQYFIQQGLVL